MDRVAHAAAAAAANRACACEQCSSRGSVSAALQQLVAPSKPASRMSQQVACDSSSTGSRAALDNAAATVQRRRTHALELDSADPTTAWQLHHRRPLSRAQPSTSPPRARTTQRTVIASCMQQLADAVMPLTALQRLSATRRVSAGSQQAQTHVRPLCHALAGLPRLQRATWAVRSWGRRRRPRWPARRS